MNGQPNPNGTVSYRYEISKYCDFDRGFSFAGTHFSQQSLADLQGEGLAQDYWVIGDSNWMTVSP